jgi:hypothetical protein
MLERPASFMWKLQVRWRNPGVKSPVGSFLTRGHRDRFFLFSHKAAKPRRRTECAPESSPPTGDHSSSHGRAPSPAMRRGTFLGRAQRTAATNRVAPGSRDLRARWIAISERDGAPCSPSVAAPVVWRRAHNRRRGPWPEARPARHAIHVRRRVLGRAPRPTHRLRSPALGTSASTTNNSLGPGPPDLRCGVDHARARVLGQGWARIHNNYMRCSYLYT